jgi:Flp pilus assembly pilin Flp
VTDCTAYIDLDSHQVSGAEVSRLANRLSPRREVNSMLKYFVALQSYTVNAVHELRNAEDGQTMAEYGVVLAVITIGAVAVFTALSGGITGAINKVIGLLPK